MHLERIKVVEGEELVADEEGRESHCFYIIPKTRNTLSRNFRRRETGKKAYQWGGEGAKGRPDEHFIPCLQIYKAREWVCMANEKG